ncbi:MAG: FecR family protein [Pseudomonadota bacterium]
MMRRRLLAVITLLALVMVIPAVVDAAAVGRFTMVEGQVDLLRQGKLPAVPAKVQDGVDPGDVIRTKSKAKAQVKFVDDSIITMAPESRIAVADFVYDQARGYRRAVLRHFRGLVHAVVTQLLNVQEPEFIIETQTAVMGVRGTGGYLLQIPNSSMLYCTQGIWQGQSKNPRFPNVFLLHMGDYAEFPMDKPPFMGRITPDMLEMLKKMMAAGVRDSGLLGGGPPPAGAGGIHDLKLPVSPDRMTQPIIPPQVIPPVHAPPSQPSGPSSPMY